jgi:serine/threonine-protein kinase
MSQDDPTFESARANEAPFRSASTPATIGRYQVRRLHGRGGMGEVFLAHDPVLDREVAVKLISGDLDTMKSQERLVREARAAGRLRHPNIVTIFDAGEHDGRPFIAMEFVRGETLGSLIRRQAPLSLSRRLELIEGACAGLAHAHRSGVVHFDIKPDNLMLDESGTVKVLDFGIARVLQSGLLVTRQLGGTLRYMSPEQIDGQPLDHRSDVFSVGCALFEMITFVPAFVGSTKDIVTQISSGPVPALRSALPEIDSRLEAIVLKAMAVDRTQRYSTLDELKTDLAAARARMTPGYDPRVVPFDVRAENVLTMPASSARPAEQLSVDAHESVARRRRWLMVAAAIVLVAAGTLWTFRPDRQQPQTESRAQTQPAATAAAPAVAAAPPAEVGAPADDAREARDTAGQGPNAPVAAPPRVTTDARSRSQEQTSPTARTPAEPDRTTAAAPPPITDAPAPPAPKPPATSTDTAASDAAAPAPVPAPPALAPPAPIVEPPRAAVATDQDAVRDTLRRYEAAYRALDINGILKVYPSLGRDQADQLRRTFATVTQYEVDIRPSQIDVQADNATVRATLARRITPRVGSPVANEAVTEFRLRRAGGAWSIVGITAR